MSSAEHGPVSHGPSRCTSTAVFRVEEYLNEARGLRAIQLLADGAGVRIAERVTGLHRNAILKLLEMRWTAL